MDAGKRRKLPTSGELAVWRAHHEAVEIARSRIESRMRRDGGQSSAGGLQRLPHGRQVMPQLRFQI